MQECANAKSRQVATSENIPGQGVPPNCRRAEIQAPIKGQVLMQNIMLNIASDNDLVSTLRRTERIPNDILCPHPNLLGLRGHSFDHFTVAPGIASEVDH